MPCSFFSETGASIAVVRINAAPRSIYNCIYIYIHICHNTDFGSNTEFGSKVIAICNLQFEMISGCG